MVPGKGEQAVTPAANTPPSVSVALPAWGVDGALPASSLTSLSADAAKTVFRGGILRLRLESSQNYSN